MKLLSLFGLLMLMLSLLITSPSKAQQPTSCKSNPELGKTCKVVLKRSGWDSPNLAQFSLDRQEEIKIGGVIVNQKGFAPLEPKTTILQTFAPTASERLEIIEIRVRVLWLNLFEVSGRPIGFSIVYGLLSEQADGTVALKGATVSAFFLDNDGDGTFETRISDINVPSTVPSWAGSRL